MTLEKQYLDHLRLSCRFSERTVLTYHTYCRDYLQNNADPFSEVSLKNHLLQKSKGYAPKTQAQMVSALKHFFHWAFRHKICSHAFEALLINPKTPQKMIRIFNEEDLALLLKVIRERPAPEQLLFELLYGSGLRLSEALDAKKKNLLEAKTSLKVKGKGGKTRIVPLTPQAHLLLKRLDTDGAGPWPFSTDARKLRTWTYQWGRMSGLEAHYGKMNPHKFRHSIATHLLRRGAKLPQIQKLLGHSDLSTTQKYTHLSLQDLLRIYDRSLPKDLLENAKNAE